MDLASISARLPDATERIDNLERDSRRRMQTPGPSFALDQTLHAWQRTADLLRSWLQQLSSVGSSVSTSLDQVDLARQQWEMTRDSTRAEDVPAEVSREIRRTLAAVDSVNSSVVAARDTVLKLQAAVGLQVSRAEQNIADERQEMERRRGALLSIDSWPLWKVADQASDQPGLSSWASTTWQLNYPSLRWYLETQRAAPMWGLTLLLVLIATLAGLRSVTIPQLEQDDPLTAKVKLFDRPVAASVLVLGLLVYLSQPSAPRSWKAILAVSVVVAALWLLPRVLKGTYRRFGYAAVLLLLLQQVVNLSEFGVTESRFALLLLSVVGVVASLQFGRSDALEQEASSDRKSRPLVLGASLAAIAFAISGVANIAGAAGFATVLATGTLILGFSALTVWLGASVLLAAAYVLTFTSRAQRLGIAPATPGTVPRRAYRFIVTLAWIGFVVLGLTGFRALDPVVAGLADLWAAGVSVGGFSLTVGDVVTFVFIVWLSVKLSQLISAILGKDILPRMDLGHGVPTMITQFTRYAVILIGILVAFSATGVDVDRLTILMGALGVGVGFGLQNVVNNLASGLVVLFGRSVNYGDEVQIEDFEGVVREIGLLQSKVRTYHGADVLVPNSTLVSSTLVNWTREGTDQRRVDIPVGVEYGTDPKTVVDVLEGVAAKQPLVARKPAPKVIFLGFGENALNFQLNVWFPEARWYGAASDLRLAASDALVAAGIGLAYPQRDLHLRTIAPGVSLEIKPVEDGSAEVGAPATGRPEQETERDESHESHRAGTHGVSDVP